MLINIDQNVPVETKEEEKAITEEVKQKAPAIFG
jgi:hypothetical protein